MAEQHHIVFDSETATIAALQHAMAHLHHASGVRLQNFNFFLVITGALIVSAYQTTSDIAHLFIAAGGLVFSLLFLGLDVREMRRIKDARADLVVFEGKLGLSLHTVDQISDRERGLPGSGRSRIVTTTNIYRTVFMLAGLAGLGWLLCLI